MLVKFVCNFSTLVCGLTLWMLASTTNAQMSRSQELVNGSMEEVGEKQLPVGWYFTSPSGGTGKVDEQVKFAGDRSLSIDASKPKAGATQQFSNLMQSIDARPWRGKKVRFRAAVKAEELAGDATVNLWFRVDRQANEKGEAPFGAFDNMQDRPIRNEAWKHYEIVLKVDDDAESIVCGMFISGTGKAWLDDATFTAASDDEKTSEINLPKNLPKNVVSNRLSISPQLAKAFQEAENAPTQPFFSHWLWLPVVAVTLFVIAMSPVRMIAATDSLDKTTWLRKFAIRFTVSYWLLYCLPNPFANLIPWAGYRLAMAHDWCEKLLVAQVARSVFRIDGELLPPNGSGDTTYNYIAVFSYFSIALAFAALWSVVDWRRTGYSVTLDLLRSYLRYVLAFAMLGYGLAKIAIDYNQFPINGPMQLEKTWGNSSPMNVLWAFMGASRPYTVFAGLGEVLAAVLLIWRRTGSLGGLVTIGVMANVAMLNFCYDVPVKLYSSHLLVMAILIVLPDASRLANVLIWNRPADKSGWINAWDGRALKWVRVAVKLVVIGFGIALPIGQVGYSVAQHFSKSGDVQATSSDSSESKYRLTRRGFRWINEVPFNR